MLRLAYQLKVTKRAMKRTKISLFVRSNPARGVPHMASEGLYSHKTDDLRVDILLCEDDDSVNIRCYTLKLSGGTIFSGRLA